VRSVPEHEREAVDAIEPVLLATDSPAETEALGRAIATVLVPGDVVLLIGELGSGKTTLTKGLAAALGAREAVTSPTFAICHLYDSEPPLAHVDCWRLTGVEELDELALDELLDDGSIVVLEWGGLAEQRFGDDALFVELALPESPGAADDAPQPRRRCALRPSGARWSTRIDALRVELVAGGLLEADRSASSLERGAR